ncbi:sugar phosphate isomerase/epimerase family protein [Actinomadura kijaniata]|uniref:sugar phosphate isomerase/epimerase family protein n=1 Tax=Actinomadura kijaniata TaxID=46161 RepID=UPI000ABC1DEB|nr:sugar phosphate isomerase/epimerase family protein [Actinomadura kijaniata]
MTRAAFSTLGVPGMPLPEVLDLAVRTGYAGLELRCAEDGPVHTGLTSAGRRAVAAALDGAGVVPLCAASYVRVAAPGPDGPVVDALRAHLDLAADLGAAHVRVFPGADPADPDAERRAAARLTAVAGAARARGVAVAVETHDSHRAGRDLARLLDGVPGARALWDVLHGHRAGETPERTHAALADRLAYVQVKDADPAGTPVALGAGTLPLDEVGRVLGAHGYDGWLCWEYEAAWHPGAAPLPALLAAGRARMERLLGPSRP